MKRPACSRNTSFGTGTYAGIQGTLLKSEVEREIGTFDAFISRGAINPPIVASSTPQRLDYEEQNLAVSLNQLVGNDWSFGARYQLTFSDLQTSFREIPVGDAA